MDIIEQRIRDAMATLLSRGAKALERTAGELEQAAGELRRRAAEDEAEGAWSEPTRDADAVTRSAPLRAVPDTPTDASAPPRVPPVKPPQTPGDADGHVTADAGPSPVADPGLLDASGDVGTSPPDAAGAPETGDATTGSGTEQGATAVATSERLRALAAGTVSEIRAQLDDLSTSELRTLRQIEVGNRNRTTLLAAIDRALDADG